MKIFATICLLRRSALVICCVICAVYLSASIAVAQDLETPSIPELVSWTFTATIVSIDNTDQLLAGSIGQEAILRGILVFPVQGLSLSESQRIGIYEFRKDAQLTIEAGEMKFGSDLADPHVRIEVINDQPKPRNEGVQDILVFRSESNMPLNADVLIEDISWQIEDPTGETLKSKQLISEVPDLSKWQSTYGLTIRGKTKDESARFFVIRAQVTQIQKAN